MKRDCNVSLCQVGAKENERIACALSVCFFLKYHQSRNREAWILSPLRSLDQNDTTICFPGPKPKHSHQFGLGKHNRDSVPLFGTPWPRRGVLFTHPRLGILVSTRHCVDPGVSQAVVRHGEARYRSRTDLFCQSLERTAKPTHTHHRAIFEK